MNFSKIKYLIIVMCFLSSYATAQKNNLSFEEAVMITFKESPTIKQGAIAQKQSRLLIQSKKGLYLPTISLDASYVHLKEDLSIDLGEIRDAIAPLYQTLGNFGNFSGVPNPDPNTNKVVPLLPDNVSTQVIREKLLNGAQELSAKNWNKVVQPQQFGRVTAKLNWPIFTGGKIITANRAEKIKAKVVSYEQQQKNAELYNELVDRYFGLSLAYSAKKIREEALEAMEKHVNDAQKLFDEGMIPKSQTLHAKVYYSSANRALKKAQRDINIIENALNTTLGNRKSELYMPTTPLFYLKNLESLEYYQQNALQKSPLLKMIDEKKRLAKQKVNIEKSNYYPNVALFANYDLYNKNLSILTPDAMVGVGLSWTIFNGLSRTKNYQAARLKVEEVNLIKEKAENNILTAVNKYYQEAKMYLEQLEELDVTLSYAKEELRIEEKAFSEGMSTSTKVVDARLGVEKVKIERLQTIYNFDKSIANLLKYSGMYDDFINYLNHKEVILETFNK